MIFLTITCHIKRVISQLFIYQLIPFSVVHVQAIHIYGKNSIRLHKIWRSNMEIQKVKYNFKVRFDDRGNGLERMRHEQE